MGPIRKVGGHGYNPYRSSDGKFAPGAHKEEPKKGRARAARSTPAKVSRTRGESGSHPATAAAREGALRKRSLAAKQQMLALRDRAKTAGPAEKRELKAEFDRLAQQRSAFKSQAEEARGQRVRQKRSPPGEPKREQPAQRQSETPPKKFADLTGEERWNTLREIATQKPRGDGELIHAFGNGGIKDERGRVVALNEDAQRAVRQHFDNVVREHGLSPRPGSESHKLETDSLENMGGANAWHYSTGRIKISSDGMNELHYHAGDDFKQRGLEEATSMPYRGDGFKQYLTLVHEVAHDHGPVIRHQDNLTHFRMAEELSTEMSARYISAHAHGFAPHLIAYETGGYSDVMSAAVRHVAELSGVNHAAAFDAVAKSAMDFKRRGNDPLGIHPTDALRDLAHGSLTHLGADTRANKELIVARWHETAQEAAQTYGKVWGDS